MKENILIIEDEFVVSNHLQQILEKNGYTICGIAKNYAESIQLIEGRNPTWVILDIFLQGEPSGIELAAVLSKKNIPFIYLSGSKSQDILEAVKISQPYGFMSKPLKEWELMTMLDIARYRHERMVESYRQTTKIFLDELNNAISAGAGFGNAAVKIAAALQLQVPFDILCLSSTRSNDAENQDLYIVRNRADQYDVIPISELIKKLNVPARLYPVLRKFYFSDNRIASYQGDEFEKMSLKWPLLKHLKKYFKISLGLIFPLSAPGSSTTLAFFSHQLPKGYKHSQITALKNAEVEISRILEQLYLLQSNPKDLRFSPPVPESSDSPFFGIIGRSPLLLSVLDNVKIVSNSEASVLLSGESGTGKEKVAQAIHGLSNRRTKPFVTINCASLPPELIESELFGHEKGSFTGAIETRIGKFEQADGGSVFLDEVGELPIEAQVKLLRVLQEKEFERVGNGRLKKVDIRIIAATNRNMEKEVAEGRFRLDLYYRLNVFPIELPPLRDRKVDIPELANYFLRQHSKNCGKTISSIGKGALEKMVNYSWPGNIRELDHVIERSVLLSKSDTITEIILPANNLLTPQIPKNGNQEAERRHAVKSIEDNERDHILAVLKKCFGRIAGAGGAADLLNVPPSTLNSKMKKLGILRKHFGPE